MTKKIVIAGGTGFIGQYFEKQWRNNGYDVKIISRQPQHISWDDHTALVEAVNEAELLINLAGKSVNCRYNEKNKQEIMGSRVRTTKLLGEVIKECEQPPKLWVNSSTATIYRHAEDRPMTEEKGEIGSGFSVDVAKAWEEAFFSFDLPKTRQVALRIAIVLGKDGGVMTPYQNLVKFGLGGAQGKGNQRFSWIHVEDLYQIILFLQEREDIRGVINCSAPNPVTNRELMEQMCTVMNRSFGLPAPKWMLELGAVFIKTETELVLKSRWVLPERLQQEGYQFKFDTLEKTLHHIVS
ncbi:TIGR01777 family oxidoreductase [Alkalihalobacillus sp. LMS39]|uniref:TIGR01777 family oxidoreductase n=1 Tax=Alkalihalobacillus sp. LMS39 TaxID=2924032 RepID=UPI001FB41710|nr:TIGR01777 family oxidoreductase [Alkalihalobacillus sp. LMS39]UOE94648.1 TIGR01777 family oxidoreductase [Alkalihalobacillus sp. LMS39]